MLRILLFILVVVLIVGAVAAALFFLARRSQVRNKYVLAGVLVTFVVVVFILPTLFFTKLLTVWELFTFASSSLNNYIGMSIWLNRAIVALAVLPFLWAVRMAFSFNRARRRIGVGTVALFACAYFLLMYFGTKDKYFTHGTGEAQKWVYMDRGGVVRIYDTEGFDTETGATLLPMTAEIRERIVYYRQIEVSGASKGDAYFDFATGKPLRWYALEADGRIEMYDQPIHHPKTGEPLKPVTPEIVEAYESRRQAEEQEQGRLRAEAAAEAERERQKEQAVAFRAKYIDTSVRNSKDVTDIALVVIPSKSKPESATVDQIAMNLINRRLSAEGFAVSGNLFKRPFFSEGRLAGLLGGQGEFLSRLGVSQASDLVIVATSAEEFFTDSKLKDTRSCRYELSVSSFYGNGKLAFQDVISATGLGFDDTSAKEKAIERLMPQLTKHLEAM